MMNQLKRRISNAKDENEDKAKTMIGSTPKSDISLPDNGPARMRRRSSLKREQALSSFKSLTNLIEAPPSKREIIFKQKLELCTVTFNFSEENISTSDEAGKELKRNTLLELVDYIQNSSSIINESTIPCIMAMVEANIFRALPMKTKDFNPEEDEPVLEPSWPHLQVVYEFFLRFIVSGEVQAKGTKKAITTEFCSKLIELFDTEDPRERDYLKTILHRIYGKFMPHRGYIRKVIQNTFYQFIYETDSHNGICELLEIIGSIVNGFALPLKKEHEEFLKRALIPLHKPACLQQYQQQLSYSITQYMEKEPRTAEIVIKGVLRFWPYSSSTKQIFFLNEFEEILELLQHDELQIIYKVLFQTLSNCISSTHFQVAERTLLLWNNENLVNNGCLSKKYSNLSLPLLYGALYNNSKGHWNTTVESLSSNILKEYAASDLSHYQECTRNYEKKCIDDLAYKEENEKKWDYIGKSK